MCLVGQRFHVTRMRIIALVAMHVDAQPTFGGELAEIAHRRRPVRHGAFEMRDTANHINDCFDAFDLLKEILTPARVKEHFKEICFGDVERFEAPNLMALNFILHDSLGGGGSESLKTDAQGKAHCLGLLLMEVER